MTGGKSRKAGGVSQKLIDRIKQGAYSEAMPPSKTVNKKRGKKKGTTDESTTGGFGLLSKEG